MTEPRDTLSEESKRVVNGALHVMLRHGDLRSEVVKTAVNNLSAHIASLAAEIASLREQLAGLESSLSHAEEAAKASFHFAMECCRFLTGEQIELASKASQNAVASLGAAPSSSSSTKV